MSSLVLRASSAEYFRLPKGQPPQTGWPLSDAACGQREGSASGEGALSRHSTASPQWPPGLGGFQKRSSRTGKCAGHENFRDIFALGVVAQSRDAGSRRVDAGNEHIGEYFRTLSGRPRRMTAAHQRAAQRRSAYMTTSAAMTMPTSTPERLKSAREASS